MYGLIIFGMQDSVSMRNGGDMNIWLYKNASEAAKNDDFEQVREFERVSEWVASDPPPGAHIQSHGFVLFRSNRETGGD